MYKATKPIRYLVDGRAWKPGDAVLLSTIPSQIAEMWIEKGIVVEDVELSESEEAETTEPAKRRGRPRKIEDTSAKG